MNEDYAILPKYKIGDLVSLMILGETCGPMLGIIIQVWPSMVTKMPLYGVHLPTGKQGVAFEKDLEAVRAS